MALENYCNFRILLCIQFKDFYLHKRFILQCCKVYLVLLVVAPFFRCQLTRHLNLTIINFKCFRSVFFSGLKWYTVKYYVFVPLCAKMYNFVCTNMCTSVYHSVHWSHYMTCVLYNIT